MPPEEPLLSVIVPVYKVEAYLDRCVESLLGQSYKHFELILVDDGSPDACPRLCDAWAEKDRRVKVLHKPNGGLSDARNQGVLLAQGDYVSFVDSDDYVSPDYLAYLLGLLRETGADIACGAYRTVDGGGETFADQPPARTEVLEGKQVCLELLGTSEQHTRYVIACGKLFPRRLTLESPFPVGRLHEDEATTYKYYCQSGTVAWGNREIYAYFQNRASITHTKDRRNQEAELLALEEQFSYYEDRRLPRLRLAAARQLLSELVYQAARGDQVCREYLAAGRERPWLLPELDGKVKLRYWGYRLLGLDFTELLRQAREKARRRRG